MQNWTDYGIIYDARKVNGINDIWASGIAVHNGTFYIVFPDGGGGGGDHVGSTGTNGTGDRDDLLSLALPGKGHGGMGHALLILPLPDLHSVGLLAQSLPKAHHVAVAGQHDHTLHERMLDAVIGDILVFQEADHRLCHSQTYGFHRLPPYPLKMWSLASGFQSQACSGSSMRVFSQGSPSRWRMPQE